MVGMLMRTMWCGLMLAAVVGTSRGRAEDAAYEQVIAGRADKILASLSTQTESARATARDALLDFYRSVNAWHDTHEAERKELKASRDAAAAEKLAALEAELGAIREQFLGRLAAVLPAEDITKIKDGLTYNVVHVTERAYREMIPSLTEAQKDQISQWLREARDLAISEGSSEAKHGVFGKYKGKINNFLSQQGYNLKQEERDWQARRKAAATTQSPPGAP